MLRMNIEKLEKILKDERKQVEKGRLLDGAFGIKACRESIEWQMSIFKKSLEEIYCDLIKRALTEFGFNTLMIIACEMMIEEQKVKE